MFRALKGVRYKNFRKYKETRIGQFTITNANRNKRLLRLNKLEYLAFQRCCFKIEI